MNDGTRFALFASAAAMLAMIPGPAFFTFWEELSTAEDTKASCPLSGPGSGAGGLGRITAVIKHLMENLANPYE